MGCMFRFTLCCIANCGNELGNYYIDRTFRSFRMADMGIKKTLSPLQIRQKASHQPQQRHKGTYIINSLYTIFISHASQYSRSNTGNSKSETKEQPGNQPPAYWVAIPGRTAIWQEKRKKASDRHRSSALLSMQASNVRHHHTKWSRSKNGSQMTYLRPTLSPTGTSHQCSDGSGYQEDKQEKL